MTPEPPQEPPAGGQAFYAEPRIAGMPYNAEPPIAGMPYNAEPPIVGMPYNATPPAAVYFPPAPPPPPVGYQQPYQQPPYPYPHYPYQHYPYARPGTNGMAIASMVLGILCLYGIGSILALVFGYRARAEIRNTGQSGDGMAIAGIVLGWIGVGIMGILLITMIAGAIAYT